MNFTNRPVEDCFDGSAIHEYKLDQALTEALIRALGKALGKLDYFKDFPKPFFRIIRPDGTQLKGCQGEDTFRATFPARDREAKRAALESTLTQHPFP